METSETENPTNEPGATLGFSFMPVNGEWSSGEEKLTWIAAA
jgi:hypothetical protein